MSDERPDDVLAVRRAKLERLRERGIEPFALRYEPDATAAELHGRHAGLEPGTETGATARVAGRLVGLRRIGQLTFGVLRDGTGDIQLMLSEDALGAEGYAVLDELDMGDWVGAQGEMITTRRGELSVRVTELTVLAKALRPLPEKWHGLKDVELRMRQRYLDFATNDEARSLVEKKARMLSALRRHLEERRFLEVETPILQTIPGGGLATPFETYHQALGLPMYLRIAPELFLKRLLVGGFERVYEIGRNFRNEGISPKYNPEFTMLEAYQAFGTYEDMAELVEGLVKAAAEAVNGSLTFAHDGREVDLAKPWRSATLTELVSEAVGRDVSLDTPVDELQRLADERGVAHDPSWGPGKMILELFEKLVESSLIEPTFVKDFPREVSPLARTHRDDPRLTEHFDLTMGGVEIAPAYSELNDPDEQRRRFELQAEQKASGEDETHPFDEDFLVALEHGMPPAGGMGLGIDRLLAILTGAPALREVIAFPAVRPEGDEAR